MWSWLSAILAGFWHELVVAITAALGRADTAENVTATAEDEDRKERLIFEKDSFEGVDFGDDGRPR